METQTIGPLDTVELTFGVTVVCHKATKLADLAAKETPVLTPCVRMAGEMWAKGTCKFMFDLRTQLATGCI